MADSQTLSQVICLNWRDLQAFSPALNFSQAFGVGHVLHLNQLPRHRHLHRIPILIQRVQP